MASLDPAAVAAAALGPMVAAFAAEPAELFGKEDRVDPSLTARIDGVDMDFCSVRMRGESDLVGSPPPPPTPPPPPPLSLDSARGLVAIEGIN